MTIKKAIRYTLAVALAAGVGYMYSTMPPKTILYVLSNAAPFALFALVIGWLLKDEGKGDDDDLS